MRKDYQNQEIDTSQPAVPDTVSVALAELAGEMREGLLAVAVGTGLQVMAAIMEAEVTAACGPRGPPRSRADRDPARPWRRVGEPGVGVGSRSRVSGQKSGLDAGLHCGLDRVWVEIGQNPADGAGVWHDRADAEGVEDAAPGVVGVLGDRAERPRPGQHRACPKQQDRRQTVADSAGVTRVGTSAKASIRDNATVGTVSRVEGDLRMILGGFDRGHLQRGHGLPGVIKDFGPHDHAEPVSVLVPLRVCRCRSATTHRDFASALTRALGRIGQY